MLCLKKLSVQEVLDLSLLESAYQVSVEEFDDFDNRNENNVIEKWGDSEQEKSVKFIQENIASSLKFLEAYIISYMDPNFDIPGGFKAVWRSHVWGDLGTALYYYTWYGYNTFRLAYLCSTFIFHLLKTIGMIISCFICYSRILDISYEMRYGERKIYKKMMEVQNENNFINWMGFSQVGLNTTYGETTNTTASIVNTL
ncbi:hypothetical protein A3Q56_05528 [Intoshia linei]|uniref:Uncharacterized protein n=1 Tax=Intoshia linei TaxID=1819745 RepID=A0A177AXK5_9BILA|nr:hypothetical protein A3Q56_05528 [Intoshia linei]